MIGIFAVAPRRADRSGMSAINRGFFISAVISLALVAIAVFVYLPSSYADLDGVTDAAIVDKDGDPRILALLAVAIGIVLAALIQQLTGYFTETTRRPSGTSARPRSPARPPSSSPVSPSVSNRPSTPRC